MKSIQMRENPLFMRTTGREAGRWDIPMLMKPSVPTGDIDLIAWPDTRPSDAMNHNRGVHFLWTIIGLRASTDGLNGLWINSSSISLS